MKATGIVRKIDDLGRIVIPRELRKLLDINERDPLEIFVDGSFIMLQKYQSSCIFCTSTRNISRYKDKSICLKCLGEIKEGSLTDKTEDSQT